MKKTILILSMFTTSALANSSNFQKDDVIWFSGTLGQASLSEKAITADEGLSIKLNLGYDFNENFALYSGIGSIRNVSETNINYLEMGLKLSYPINNDWAVYTAMGGTSTTSNDASGVIQPKIALGVDYQITPRFKTHITYDHLANIGVNRDFKTDVNQISWGLTYHFGRSQFSNKNIQQIKIYQ